MVDGVASRRCVFGVRVWPYSRPVLSATPAHVTTIRVEFIMIHSLWSERASIGLALLGGTIASIRALVWFRPAPPADRQPNGGPCSRAQDNLSLVTGFSG